MIRSNGVEKVSDGGFCQSHRHTMPADNRGRHNAIRAGSDQLRLSLLFRSTSDDVNAGVQVARCQDYVDVVSVIGKASGETAGMFDSGFDQALFERGVTHEHRDPDIHQCFAPLRIALDDEKHAVDCAQASYQMRPDSARTADDKMVSQLAHFS